MTVEVKAWLVGDAGTGQWIEVDEHRVNYSRGLGRPAVVLAEAFKRERDRADAAAADARESLSRFMQACNETADADAEVERLRARVDKLEAALRPFAIAAEIYDGSDGDGFSDDPAAHGRGAIRVSTLRAARIALAPARDAE